MQIELSLLKIILDKGFITEQEYMLSIEFLLSSYKENKKTID